MKSLLEEAAKLGVQVHRTHLPRGLRGYYNHGERRIGVCLSLTPREAEEVLAHELGHAHHGHECGPAANEAQADRRAALLLVDPDDYVAAELEHPAVGAIAERLDLDPRIILAWRQHWLPRLRDRWSSE